jgi:hypothetical protein
MKRQPGATSLKTWIINSWSNELACVSTTRTRGPGLKPWKILKWGWTVAVPSGSHFCQEGYFYPLLFKERETIVLFNDTILLSEWAMQRKIKMLILLYSFWFPMPTARRRHFHCRDDIGSPLQRWWRQSPRGLLCSPRGLLCDHRKRYLPVKMVANTAAVSTYRPDPRTKWTILCSRHQYGFHS